MKFVAIIIVLLFCSGCNQKFEISEIQNSPISVEISGEVRHPGVYTLEYGSTLNQLLEQAELKSTADISGLNSLMILKDHDSIVVRKIEEQNELISINTGSLQQLDRLPGIGPVIAQRIIDYRELHGFFQNLEDLKKVKGIGEKTYNKLKDQISL